MRFKVMGSNRQSGSRMTLELEANNRAAAERAAAQAGMEVLHIEQIVESQGEAHGSKHRGEVEPSGGMTGKLLLLLVLVAAIVAGYMYWDRIRSLLP